MKVDKCQVKLVDNVTIPAKSEILMTVKAKDGNGLMQCDFQPNKLKIYPGVYAANAKVIPDKRGVFYIAVVNTNYAEVKL